MYIADTNYLIPIMVSGMIGAHVYFRLHEQKMTSK